MFCNCVNCEAIRNNYPKLDTTYDPHHKPPLGRDHHQLHEWAHTISHLNSTQALLTIKSDVADIKAGVAALEESSSSTSSSSRSHA